MSTFQKSTNKAILLCVAAYAIFSMQDAVMKWMVSDFGVAELLFWRSLAALLICLMVGRKKVVQDTIQSPVLKPLIWRSLIAAFAWVFYYLSAKELSLAQMTTIYYSAPIIVVVLAVALLKEKPTKLQWASVFIGFIGVLIASRPEVTGQALSIFYALFSALLWAYTYILLRQLSGKASVLVQMVAANFMFIVITGVSLPWTLSGFDTQAILIMMLTGIIGAAGQYFLFASFEYAEATTLAPIEYTGLIWAFTFSYLIWGAGLNAFLITGATLIAVSGFMSVIANNHKNKQLQHKKDASLPT